MAATYTANRTWTSGELCTAAIFNQYVRDNLDWFKTPTTSGRIQPAANFSSAAITSYTDVTGLTTTITTNGGGLDVNLRVAVSNSSPVNVFFQLVVDGVTTYLLGSHFNSSTNVSIFNAFEHIPALSAGSHTIKVQAKAASGTTGVTGATAATQDPLFYVREAGA